MILMLRPLFFISLLMISATASFKANGQMLTGHYTAPAGRQSVTAAATDSHAPLTWGHQSAKEARSESRATSRPPVARTHSAPALRSSALPANNSLTGYRYDSQPAPLQPVSEPSDRGTQPKSDKAFHAPVIQASESAMPEPTIKPEAEDSSISGEEQAPVDLQADSLQHDEQTQIITASGNVILEQSGRTLRADEVTYDLKSDQVTASGGVVLRDVNGDVHRADRVVLKDKLKDGFVESLFTVLQDGSRFRAREGERRQGTKTIMREASYTPCEPCEEDPDSSPAWQIKASEVVHNEEERRVYYEDASFEFFGVPVAYLPFFSHSDGTIERKSGFLSPSFGFKSELGAFVTNEYYWDIVPDKDATIGLMAMTEQAPLATAEYRQRWDNARFQVNGGITYSDRIDLEGERERFIDDELRGHVFADGLWDINNKWRAGMDIDWASDDQYMRRYDFSNDDVLESELYAERFSGRNYAAVRFLAFQDVRVREEREDQPEVLPEIVANFTGEPGSVPLIGGTWSLEASALGLRRNGAGQDLNRASINAVWNRRIISQYGLVSNVEAKGRADYYNTRDRDVATPGSGISGTVNESRFFTSLHAQSSYPVVKDFETSQLTVEPVVAVTLAPNIDVNDDIPNEDSRDVQIDASNLFEPNRFPGFDRIEDQSRVTYGLRTGLYGHDGSYGSVFVGQSYRFDEDDNPFPAGSGLNRQESDVVGQIAGNLRNNIGLNYRFQLSSENLSSQRHEVNAFAGNDRFSLSSRYLFAKALEGTDIRESREQIEGSAAYYLTEDWRVFSSATQDLGAQPGLRKAAVGLDYFDQCWTWTLIGERSLTDDASGESDTEIVFRIGLKNLGEFEESGLRKARSK